MNYIKIDMNTYPRLNHFEYFLKHGYPYVGVTVPIDITNWLKWLKANDLPFFLSCLYVLGGAANQVKELRQRIVETEIIEFECCLSSYTLALEDNTYSYCSVDTSLDFNEFIKQAKIKQEAAKNNPSLDDGPNALSLFYVSSLPWLSFSQLVQPVPFPADSNPRITIGRYYQSEDKILLPVSILAHHSLVDGYHLHLFYQAIDEILNSMYK